MAYYPSNFYSSYNYNTPQPQYQQSVYPQQISVEPDLKLPLAEILPYQQVELQLLFQ